MNYPKIDLANAYEVDAGWPKKPANVEWGHVPGVAVDGQGRVYMFTRSRDPVQVYDADGTFLRTWGQGMFLRPHQARVDPEGNLWLTDCDRHVAEKYTPEGKLLMRLGTDRVPGCDESHLNEPTDITIRADGDLFVADGYGNSRIAHFDRTGRFVKAWGSLGVEPGQLSLPHVIGVDSNGRLYVGERNNVRIQVFDADGRFVSQWRHLITPWGLCVNRHNEIRVVGSSPMCWKKNEEQLGGPPKDQIFTKFNPDGKLLELWSVPKAVDGHEKPGECNWAHCVAEDYHGNLFIGEIQGRRVQKFIPLPWGKDIEAASE